MRYLIIPHDSEPFLTNNFTYENNYYVGMTVFDLRLYKYTMDGKEWFDLHEDVL